MSLMGKPVSQESGNFGISLEFPQFSCSLTHKCPTMKGIWISVSGLDPSGATSGRSGGPSRVSRKGERPALQRQQKDQLSQKR
jgi:hypothetical protein